MSAIFNGSSHLWASASPLGSTPNYGLLFACWFQRTSTSGAEVLLSSSNNLSSTSRHSIAIYHSSGTLRANSFTSGAASEAITSNTYSADTWTLAVGWWPSTTSRAAKLGTGSFATASATHNASGQIRVGIGVAIVGDTNGAFTRFTGRIAEAGMWAGVTNDSERDSIVDLLVAGIRPTHAVPSKLVLYQPLVAGANESQLVGPTLTAVGSMSYDSGDHPPIIVPPYPYAIAV